jgi:hypothetical protein
MNDLPPVAEYGEDFQYMVLIAFEKRPDWEVERMVEALGGVVLQEQVHVTGGTAERRPWLKRHFVRQRLVRIFGLHRFPFVIRLLRLHRPRRL